MTTIEHQQIKGITIKNIITTISCAVVMTASVVSTYFSLSMDVKDVRSTQETTNRINEIRLKLLESQVSLLQAQVREIQSDKKK